MKKIIAVAGLIGSGKDTIADYLCTFHGFKRMAFAGSLKDAVATVFNWDREMVEGSTKLSREWREQVDPWWSKRLAIPHLTPRWVLQNWGTEVCRAGFHDDIWIASLENKLLTTNNDVVITDCRFANEFNIVKNYNGTTLRVERGPNPSWFELAKTANDPNTAHIVRTSCIQQLNELKIHASEYSSVGLEYDFHIDNNGTIDDLHKTIESIINR